MQGARDNGEDEDVEADGTSEADAPFIPDPEPADRESGKRFMFWRPLDENVPLRVRIGGGNVQESYAPAQLLADVAQAVTYLLKEVGSKFPPMIYGVVPESSMSIYFGDPAPNGEQEQLALGVTESNALRVANVLAADEEDVFAAALRLGTGAKPYRDLARLIESQGIEFDWYVRDQDPIRLTPDLASRQFTTLAKDPPVRERPMTVNGRLYRVIDEPRDENLGTVGIHLFPWSAHPPLWPKGGTLLAAYRDRDVRDDIKRGLIGENVEAVVNVLEPVLGRTLEPDRRPDLILAEVRAGPSATSHFGQLIEGDGEPDADERPKDE